jgi:putative ABC transport system permease protein
MQEAVEDLKFAIRLWSKPPSEAAFVVLALAIGIGASTGVFSVVNTLLLRSLPFHEPDRLVLLQDFIPPHNTTGDFHDWRQHTGYLSDAALFEENDANLLAGGIAIRAHATQASWNFFSVLGLRPVLGRALAAGDDVDGTGWGLPGPNSEAVIGYGLWQQLFGGEPNVLGATILIDGKPLTVVGVAPPGFDLPGKSVLWKAAAFSSGNNGWGTVARLKPGISWPQARAAFLLDVARLSQAGKFDSSHLRPRLMSLHDGLLGTAKNASLIFMGAVTLVLLIACMNVANLLIARTAARSGEFATRSALGASRFRLARQLLTECLLLAVVATLLGLAIAHSITLFAARIEPPPLGAQSYSIFDRTVFGFVAAISILATSAFGIWPALYPRRQEAWAMRTGNCSRTSRLLRESLVAGQVMLTIILLAGSVSLGRAFIHLMHIDRGYDVQNIVTVSVSLDGTTHQLGNRQLPYFEEVLDRIRRLPGVRSASATEFLPLYASAFVGGPFGLDHHPAARSSSMIPVLSGYFQTMGARTVAGREFTEAEVRSGARVAVVNEQFAAGFGPPENALGHALTIDNDSWRIVGVVKGMEYETDPTTAGGNQVFVPSTTPGGFFSTFVVRVDGRTDDFVPVIRDTIQSVDPKVPVFGAKSMQQRLDEFFVRPKFYRSAVWLFAGFTMLLAVIGIYGMVSYAVIQRTREMGIRMALGRTPSHLRGMLLHHGLLTVLIGAIPGVAGAQFTGRFLVSLVDGAKGVGVANSIGLLLLFALTASASIWSATRQLAALDVVSLLRSE